MMKDLLLSGSSLLQIARKLNEQGYRTKHGNLWDARGVRYVLEIRFMPVSPGGTIRIGGDN